MICQAVLGGCVLAVLETDKFQRSHGRRHGGHELRVGRNFALPNVFDTKSWRKSKAEESA